MPPLVSPRGKKYISPLDMRGLQLIFSRRMWLQYVPKNLFQRLLLIIKTNHYYFFRFSFIPDRKQPKTFAFDHCFYSTDKDAPNFASQEIVFDSVGRDILENSFQGYNACIFAYGQTGMHFYCHCVLQTEN